MPQIHTSGLALTWPPNNVSAVCMLLCSLIHENTALWYTEERAVFDLGF